MLLNLKSIGTDALLLLQYKAAKVAFVACCLMVFHSASAEEIDKAIALKNQTLLYAVKYQKLNAGKLEIIIERSNKQIKTTAISHLSALARLFLTDLTIETWLDIEHEKVSLNRGHVLSSNNKVVERGFAIDWQHALIKLEPGGKHIPINAAEIFEPASFPIVLITSDIESIAGQTVQETTSKGINEYVYLAPQQQTLELNGRKIETWKVTRQKPNDTTRTVTIWLDKNNQQIPVKIVTTRKNKNTIMTLLPES